MDLLSKINSLFSGNHGLEQSIETNLQKTPHTTEDIDSYLRSLSKDLRSAIEHQDKGYYLLALVLREIRMLDWQMQQIQSNQASIVVELDFRIEKLAIHKTRNLLTSHFSKIVELVERMEKRIALLQQTLDIQSKRKSESG